MQVLLREGDLDARLRQRGVQPGHQVAAGRAPVVEAARPGADGEVQRAGAEPGEQHRRGRIVCDARCGTCGLLQQLHHPRHVRAVGHAQVHVDAAVLVDQRPVGHLVRQQHAVGHHHVGAVVAAHRGGAHADGADAAGGAADVHRIAWLDGPLEHQDQAGDEVAHHVLQAQADAHAQCAEHEGQLADLEARRRQRRQQADQQQHVVAQRRHAVVHAARQRHARQHFLAQQRTQGPRDPHRQHHADGEHQHVAQADGQLAVLEAMRDDGLGRVVHRPEDTEAGHRVGDPADHRRHARPARERVEQVAAMPAHQPQPAHLGARAQPAQQGFQHRHRRIQDQREVAALDDAGRQHFRQRHVAQHVRDDRRRQDGDAAPGQAMHELPGAAGHAGVALAARAPQQPAGRGQRQQGERQVVQPVEVVAGHQQDRQVLQQVERGRQVGPRPKQATALLRHQPQHRHQRDQHRQLVQEQRRVRLEHQHADHGQQQPRGERTSDHARLGLRRQHRGRIEAAAPVPPRNPQQHRQQQQLQHMQQPLIADIRRGVLGDEAVLLLDLALQAVRHVLPQDRAVLHAPQWRGIQAEQAPV